MDINVLLSQLEMATQWGLKPEHREVAIALIKEWEGEVSARARLAKPLMDDEALSAYWAKPPLFKRLDSARMVLTGAELSVSRDDPAYAEILVLTGLAQEFVERAFKAMCKKIEELGDG